MIPRWRISVIINNNSLTVRAPFDGPDAVVVALQDLLLHQLHAAGGGASTVKQKGSNETRTNEKKRSTAGGSKPTSAGGSGREAYDV
eukprot:scaffold256039_cov32-Prasinocladus_malaysianus.AAC.2